MSGLLKRYNAWRLRRKEFSPERWAAVRAKGRGPFILRQAFSFAVFMMAFHDVASQFFDYGHPFTFWFISQYAISGMCLGYGMWEDREGKYEDALRNRRLNRLNPL